MTNPDVWLCLLETVLAQHLDPGDPDWPEPQGSVPCLETPPGQCITYRASPKDRGTE